MLVVTRCHPFFVIQHVSMRQRPGTRLQGWMVRLLLGQGLGQLPCDLQLWGIVLLILYLRFPRTPGGAWIPWKTMGLFFKIPKFSVLHAWWIKVHVEGRVNVSTTSEFCFDVLLPQETWTGQLPWPSPAPICPLVAPVTLGRGFHRRDFWNTKNMGGGP